MPRCCLHSLPLHSYLLPCNADFTGSVARFRWRKKVYELRKNEMDREMGTSPHEPPLVDMWSVLLDQTKKLVALEIAISKMSDKTFRY